MLHHISRFWLIGSTKFRWWSLQVNSMYCPGMSFCALLFFWCPYMICPVNSACWHDLCCSLCLNAEWATDELDPSGIKFRMSEFWIWSEWEIQLKPWCLVTRNESQLVCVLHGDGMSIEWEVEGRRLSKQQLSPLLWAMPAGLLMTAESLF